MSDFEVLGVDHVTITAPEELVEDVVTWYGDCFGLERKDKPQGTSAQGAWFLAGQQEIHISVDEHNPHKTSHFGLVVSDFDATVSKLRGAKCHIEQAPPIQGRKRFFTRDPAGNRIEVVFFGESQSSVVYEES